MNRTIKQLLCAGIFLGGQLSGLNYLAAQTPQEDYDSWKRQAMGAYNRYRQEANEDYQTFRKKANEEYAEFVRSAWASVGKHPAIPVPDEPMPPQPPAVVPDERPKPEAIPHEEVAPVPAPQPVPEVPMPTPAPAPSEKSAKVAYYGTTLIVHLPQGEPPTLKSLDGEELSKAWKTMSNGDYDVLLADCLKEKKNHRIGDWGYIKLLEKVSKSIVKEHNGAVLLQHWLLAQSGYHSRMAQSGKGVLQIWMPFDVLVYNLPYIELNGRLYFLVTDNDQDDNNVTVLDKAFPGESLSSLRAVGRPKLEYTACGQKTLSAKKYPTAKLRCEVNRNLIDYYNDYPKVAGSWDIYAGTSLSDEAKRMLYPKLQTLLQGKTELQKAELVLNWVQTAFQYKTDEEQFGGERSLFADETLYYPYCDCEDRSILLSILVRDLLGLDVVLLHFPGHLATAVKFKTDVEGDYLDLDDGRYIVCDPTYIGAPVGMAMPDCKKQEVRVFLVPQK